MFRSSLYKAPNAQASQDKKLAGQYKMVNNPPFEEVIPPEGKMSEGQKGIGDPDHPQPNFVSNKIKIKKFFEGGE